MQNEQKNEVTQPHKRWEADYAQVQEILAGNREAWEHLYWSAYPIVLHTVRRTDYYQLFPQEHEDIVAEAFARSYAQLDRFCFKSCFSTWVSGIAKNITKDRCSRQQTRYKNARHLEALANYKMLGSDPFLILLRYERDRCLWQAFFHLDIVAQEIMQRRCFEKEAYQKIADDLHLPVKEVRNRLSIAKARMKSQFLYYYNHMQQ